MRISTMVVLLVAAVAMAAARAVGGTAAAAAAAAAVEPLRIDGLVTAVFTPFDTKGNVDLSVVPAQEAYLQATGVDWVFVGGTTGESLSLSVSERKSLAEAWMKTNRSVIVHVGAESVVDATELASHAHTIGAQAVGTMPPVFFSPATATALALWLKQVCGASATIPCYYYHIPSMTHWAQPMFDLVKAIEAVDIPNFAGIKYTGLYTYPGFMDAQRVLNYREGKYEVLSGREDMMLEALSMGIKGHVGSQFNVAADLYNDLRTDFALNGLTNTSAPRIRAKQMRGVSLIEAWTGAPAGINANKFFMTLAGVPVGDGRLPSLPIDEDTAKTLTSAFDGFCKDVGGDAGLHMCA